MTTPTGAMRRNKYRNVPTMVDGIRFASKAEAARYLELKLLERAGEITGLELQKRYQLKAATGEHLAYYRADFDYDTRDSRNVVTHITEDVKGVRTPAFNLKAKLFKAQFGFDITIVGARK